MFINTTHLFSSLFIFPQDWVSWVIYKVFRQEPYLLVWKKRIRTPNSPLRGFWANERKVSPLDGGIKNRCPFQVEELENDALLWTDVASHICHGKRRAHFRGQMLFLCSAHSGQQLVAALRWVMGPIDNWFTYASVDHASYELQMKILVVVHLPMI